MNESIKNKIVLLIFFISIIRLSAKGTDGVMKRRCFRLKLMFAILFTGVLGILQRPWR